MSKIGSRQRFYPENPLSLEHKSAIKWRGIAFYFPLGVKGANACWYVAFIIGHKTFSVINWLFMARKLVRLL